MDHILRQFITEHQDDDTTKLLLSRRKWPSIDIDLAVNTIEGRRRIVAKVPEWGSRSDLLYPTRLCTEQCSSAATAAYKASIAERMGWKRIADLTGGLGVDSWYLARRSEAVLHNEADGLLSESVRENFAALGTMNIKTRSMMVEPGNVSEVLDGFGPDVVFMDPARRSESGKKVFLIEDCQPDVLGLKDEIFAICRWIFLKLSPMADITMAVERLGNVTEVHTVATGGECKELLILMDRESRGEPYRLFVHDSGNTIEFDPEEERRASAVLPRKAIGAPEDGAGLPGGTGGLVGMTLFEPGKALGKAGVPNSLCDRFNLVKLGRFTNLYLAGEDGNAGYHGPGTAESIMPFGKTFQIDEVHTLDKRSIKSVGDKLGWADVTARNIPLTSEELGKKMGLSPKKAKKTEGHEVVPHVFGIKVDWKDSASENLLLVTRPRT
ncbi:MAG: class I SAM-dependent methyltransferase [Bacteroidales bacterium]|nr:class I SAM-dependent methyltransferase [Bacteroidales bacterium]